MLQIDLNKYSSLMIQHNLLELILIMIVVLVLLIQIQTFQQ